MINLNSKIYIAGHNGLVGSAILRSLKKKGYKNLIYVNKSRLDLLDQNRVFKFLKRKKPDFIFIAAAKVGGILANNNYKADFIYQNLAIQNKDISFQMSKGTQLRDYLNIKDVAKYIYKISSLKKDLGIINICSNIPISICQSKHIFIKTL